MPEVLDTNGQVREFDNDDQSELALIQIARSALWELHKRKLLPTSADVGSISNINTSLILDATEHLLNEATTQATER